MKAFSRLYMVGTVTTYPQRQSKVFVEVEYKVDGEKNQGRLSITGVVGPTPNGDACGGCGQITDTLKELVTINTEEGWAPGSIESLHQVWDRWHLNDMKSACEHQRQNWNLEEPIEVVMYKLTHAAMRQRTDALHKAQVAGLKGVQVDLDPTERALAELDTWFQDVPSPPDADSPLSGCYEVSKRETTRAASVWWSGDTGKIYGSCSDRGLLCKPCEVCGYKLGTSWLYEEVPADVLEWLAGIEDTQQQYPWRRR